MEGSDDEFGSAVSSTQLLMAVLAILIEERERRTPKDASHRASVVLLSDLGFPSGVIANLLGRQAGSVRMAISRERRKQSTAPAPVSREPTQPVD